MRKYLRWCSLPAIAAIGLVLASCGDENGPTAIQEANTPTVTETGTTPTTTPALDMHFGTTNGDCLNEFPDGTERFNNVTCTANDVEIKVLEVLEVNGEPVPAGGTVTCTEGEELDLTLRAYFGLNAQERYDVSYFLAEDGGDAIVGDCFHGILEPIDDGGAGTPTAGPPYNGPYRDLEDDVDPTDACGDAAEDDNTTVDGIADPIAAIIEVPKDITIICEDDDDDGFVEIGTCTSWDQLASAGSAQKPTCNDEMDAFPGTTAKCNCRPAPLPINVMRSATVEVKKSLSPTDDAGTFDLVIYDWEDTEVDGADAVGHNGTTGQHTIQWFRDDEPEQNQASVEEDGANLGSLDETTTPSAFDFYTTTYSCVDNQDNNDGNGPIAGNGTGPVDLTLENGDEWVCTFTNTRIPPPVVTVTKDATESFDRAWSWQLAKTVYENGATAPAEVCSTLGDNIEGQTLALQLGQDLTACYVVTATPGGPTDTNHKVSGTINVSVAASTAPYSGDFSVTDAITPGPVASADVDCDGTAGAPYDNTKDDIAQGGSFSCTYSVSLSEAQADAATTNTATCTVLWNTGDTTCDDGTAAVDFSTATPTTETDETADVTDTWYDQPNFNLALGILASDGVDDWTFARDLTCPDYGDTLIENDAFLVSNDGGYDLTADADVTVSCPRPPDGCTLTQGFWKTHSSFGPAPYAEGWEVIPGGAGATFGLPSIESGMSYYDVLWDAGKGGNMWFKLAHQYIAAYLNIGNGADPSPVSDQMADAASILDFYDVDDGSPDNTIPKQGSDWCDTQPAGSACESYNSDRQYATYLNNHLTQYNEGLLGVPHCDDDAQSLAGEF